MTRIPENIANLWVEIYKITQIVTVFEEHPIWRYCLYKSSLTLHSRETSWILLLITVEYTFSFATAYFRQWWRKCNRLFMVSSCGVEMEHTTLRSRDRSFGELIVGINAGTVMFYPTVSSSLGACGRHDPVRNLSWIQKRPSRWTALSKRVTGIARFGPPGVWDQYRWPEVFGMRHLGSSQSLV